MNGALALSVGMARSWVALYTLRLPLDIREARRSEIDSDLWEQQWLAARRGDPVFGTAIEVLARMLLGIISDITWRAQAAASARADRGKRMNEALYMRMGSIGVILALLVFLGAGGVASYWMLGLAAIAVAVIALLFFRDRRRSVTNEIGGDLMKTTLGNRWKWLLLIIGVCVAAVVGIWSYAIGLEGERGGALTLILGVGALLAMAIGFTALVMLVSDLIGKRFTQDG